MVRIWPNGTLPRNEGLKGVQPSVVGGSLDRGEGNVEVKVAQTQTQKYYSDLEIARRLAFLLAKGDHAADQLARQRNK